MPKAKADIKPIKISPTGLNLLKECPRCFWMKYVKKIGRPDAPFPSLPNGIDNVLKDHFDGHRKKGTVPVFIRKHKISAKLYPDMDKMDIWRNARKGIVYTDPKTGIVLGGAVDELLIKDGKIIVLDFKTRGYPIKEDTAHHYQDQLNMYNFLLRKNGYETADIAYLLFFHPKEIEKDGDFAFSTELAVMEVNMKHAEDLFNRAVKVLTGAMPASSKECKFCEWKEINC